MSRKGAGGGVGGALLAEVFPAAATFHGSFRVKGSLPGVSVNSCVVAASCLSGVSGGDLEGVPADCPVISGVISRASALGMLRRLIPEVIGAYNPPLRPLRRCGEVPCDDGSKEAVLPITPSDE